LKKGKREFSLSDPACDFLGTYGHFNVPQSIKNSVKIREASYFTIAAPILFTRYQPCDIWPFGMLKGVLKDCEFNSNDEIEEAITRVWDELTFDEGQNVFHNWMSHLAWVIENEGEYLIK
jgi:hypothetical protein